MLFEREPGWRHGRRNWRGLTSSDGRADYVMLLTDGLPNCNTNNPNALCNCGGSCTSAFYRALTGAELQAVLDGLF